MSQVLLVYGATGYVGEEVVRTAVSSGLTTIAAGRNSAKLQRLEEELGVETRVFDLTESAALDRGLADAAVVLNCAGPFKFTAAALVDACLRRGIHYLDITGEIPVFEMIHGRDAEAGRRGVMLLPGVGFDVVPTDCLALYLKQKLPSADRLTMAFQSVGPAGLPPGTQRTAIELLPYGTRVRRDGMLVKAANPAKAISVDFGGGPVIADLITWGDVFTAFHSTGIPNIEDYVATTPAFRRQLAFSRAIGPIARFAPMRRLLGMSVKPGASRELRALTKTMVWGEATDARGDRVAARIEGPEAGLDWTKMTSLAAARKALDGVTPAGYQTPASAFGAGFVLEGEGVTLVDVA